MPVTVRFAPSPTGRLHVGNIRTALLNWLFARQTGGAFWLRLDDTDVQRSTEEFADGIRHDLEWLGLNWTREERQSARTDRYVAAAEKLKKSRPPLRLLRDRGRTRPQAQAPARARPAAHLRSRGTQADGGGARRPGSRGPQAALALPARQLRGRPDAAADHRVVERPDPRRSDGRRRLAVRSGRHPRRRLVPLHLHQRRR